MRLIIIINLISTILSQNEDQPIDRPSDQHDELPPSLSHSGHGRPWIPNNWMADQLMYQKEVYFLGDNKQECYAKTRGVGNRQCQFTVDKGDCAFQKPDTIFCMPRRSCHCVVVGSGTGTGPSTPGHTWPGTDDHGHTGPGHTGPGSSGPTLPGSGRDLTYPPYNQNQVIQELSQNRKSNFQLPKSSNQDCIDPFNIIFSNINSNYIFGVRNDKIEISCTEVDINPYCRFGESRDRYGNVCRNFRKCECSLKDRW